MHIGPLQRQIKSYINRIISLIVGAKIAETSEF